jgi:nucleoside-diphosphate-sugar epimerase
MAQAGGWDVWPVVRTEESANNLRVNFPNAVVADAVGEEFWKGLLGAWDGLIFALAPSRKVGGSEFEAIHREGAVRAAAWGQARGLPIVYLSSTSVYAEAGGGWVDETSAVAEDDSRAMAMVTAERATLQAGGTVVRCAGIYGPGREIRPNAGGPERWLNVIEVEDAARAVGAVLRKMDPAFAGRADARIFNACEDEALARGEVGGVWKEGSVRSRRSKRVRNQKLKEIGWNPMCAAGRSKN